VLWAQRRSTNTFMGAVLGGMVGRMGLMLAAVVAGVLVLGLPKVPLAISLLAYFVLFLVFEISVLQKQRPGAVEGAR
jgi:branched-subunit amino acid ABC-type transport system permease component